MSFASKCRYRLLAVLTPIMLGVAGCATVKPSYVDTSGGKIKSVTVDVSFRNLVTDKPSDQALSEALKKYLCKNLAGHGVTCNPDQQTATHQMFIKAVLFSRHIPGASFWNSCLYVGKDNRCAGGMDKSPDTPAYMSMTVKVIDSKTEKTVFAVDKPQSFSSSDSNEWAASAIPANAVVKGLKESGLID